MPSNSIGSGVRAFAVHPGMVATKLARHMTREDVAAVAELPEQREVSRERDSSKLEVLTPEQGAATQVWAAVSRELDGTGGVYLADCAIRSDVAPYAIDAERAGRLWQLSEGLCDQVESSVNWGEKNERQQ
jgi:NAD(P)-dependent dehydrogenase (short-subunit alcohol dehydrogenase family)